MLPASWTFDTIEKGNRFINAEKLGSLGQRALKLLAVKVGVLEKKSAPSAIPAELCASVIGPDSSSSGVELFSKFEGQ